ncbi:MAG: P-II family nitrogen regulator [Bacilli bacterium]|nr:P-II family nitrogen regulator [Bacilli bacterium]
MTDTKAQLVIIICNHDYADEVMDVAKSSGAKGGTIIHGRGTLSKEAKKFFGITIQPEKALILILTDLNTQENIMKSINEKASINTDAHAVSFALPVSDYIGLNI